MSVMEVKDIRKAFSGNEILHGISVTVERGDVVAILGPSGSGKTTLLRCMNFLETPDSGMMIFHDHNYDLAHMSHHDIAKIRMHTGFVFQNYNLFANRTALQNVTEGLIVARKMPKEKADEIGMNLLKKVGMDNRADHYPSQLSGGQQQRVAIARAIAGSPPILLADEPTGNLDTASGQQIMDILTSLWRQGRTLILITHDPDVARAAPRIIRIQDGCITQDSQLLSS